MQLEKGLASTLHSKVEPGAEDENEKVGVGLLVGLEGPPTIVVCGTTVNDREAGVGSTLPAASIAWTSKLWGPSRSSEVVVGDVQGSYGLPSTLQANVEPGFDDVNAKVGVALLVLPDGPPVIVVSGAAADAGDAEDMNRAPTASATILLGFI
jgi:hypothetical protein